MADLRQVLKSKGVKASNKPKRKINFHTEEILEIYEDRHSKQILPLVEPEFIETPTEEFSFIKEGPLVISEPEIKNILVTTQKQLSNNLVTPTKQPGNILETDQKHSENEPVTTYEANKNTSVTFQKQPSNTFSHTALFTQDPHRMDFLLLKGVGKKILNRLIEMTLNGPIEVINEDLAKELEISPEHFYNTVRRLKERGFINYESHLGWRVYSVNPCIIGK